MRIFLLLGKSDTPVFIIRLCEALVRSGNKIFIIGNLHKRIPVKGLHYLDYGPSHINFRFFKVFLRNIISDFGNMLNYFKAVINKDILQYRKYQMRLFEKKHMPDIVHVQWSSDVIMVPDQLLGKTIVSLRGRLINSAPLSDEILKNTYLDYFPRVGAFHGVSQAICEEAGSYGASSEKCKVVYSGLDLSNFPLVKKNKKSKVFNIISIGRPHWKKGYLFALDALKLLTDKNFPFQYLIVGGIHEETLYHRHQLNLNDHIELTPKETFHQVKKLIQSADLLLLPSVEEGIANVALEAMALGTPVLSTDCGGMNEVIENGINGWLVPVRDSFSMAEAIKRIALMPMNELNSIAANGRSTIEKMHTQKKMIEGMIALYHQVLNQ